jgi:hypothetical protein
MPYEAVSRALAYVSCLTTMSLFATSMAIAAVNVGTVRSAGGCPPAACTAQVEKPPGTAFGSLTSKAHVDAIAAAHGPKKI